MKGEYHMLNKCNTDHLIDRITEARTKNNLNWMALIRLAFKYAPKDAALIMQNITKRDMEISKYSKQLGKIK